ncbi:MAG: alpha-2-macroglobulin, partial [Myxococcales bacterium]|nr:alpha-2-macroglobulin [Myxococcales bacterium]
MRRSLLPLLACLTLVACRDEAPPGPTPTPEGQTPAVPSATPLISPDAPPPEAAEAAPVAPTIAPSASAEPLRVAVAVPEGEVDGLVRPSITFNKPVRALGEGDDASPPALIEPAIPGRWRRLGSATIEFVPDRPAPLATAYTVRVPAGLVALDGGTLADEHHFSFETARPRPLHGSPVNAWSPYRFARSDEVFEVYFDQPLVRATLDAGIVIRGPQADTPVEIMAIEPQGKPDPVTSVVTDRRVLVRFKPKRPLTLDAEHELVFAPTLRGEEGPLTPKDEVVWPFRTYGPLVATFVGCKSWYGACASGPLTVEFSTPVTTKALKAALAVEPPVDLYWSDDEQAESTTWAISGAWQPASRYRIRLAGLTDTFGQRLEAHEGELVTGDFSPYLGTLDDEALLERGLRAALPLVHVNMEKVEVGFAHLSVESALPWIQQPWRKEAPSGLTWREVHLEGLRNQRLRTPLDLDPLFSAPPDAPAGKVALVRLQWQEGRDKRSASTVVQVSGLGVHVKTSPNNTAAWVWTLADGKPAAGAEVVLLDADGKALAQATTADDGVAQLPGVDAMPLPQKNQWGGRLYGPPFIAAKVTLGGDVAVATTRDTWSFSAYRFGLDGAWENTPPEAEGLVFTERGIYRPGETVYVKGLLRERSLGKLRTPTDRSVKIVLRDPDGDEISTTTKPLSAFGTFDAELALPADGRLGTYGVNVTDETTGLEWSTSARVAEYRPPAFLVDVQPGDAARYAGEPVKAVVEGHYLFGAIMAGAEVSWSMAAAPGRFEPAEADGYVFGHRFEWWEDESGGESVVAGGTWTLGDDGRFQITAGPAETPKDRPQTYTVEARVTDVDRQQVAGRASFPVHPAAHYVGVRGPAGFAEASKGFDVQLVARAADDERRVAVNGVTLKLIKHQWNTVKKKNAWGAFETVSERQEVEVARCTVDVPADAPAKCALTAPDSGYHELVAESTDVAGRTTVTTDGLWVTGPGYAAWLRDDDNRVQVVADRGTYDVGDTARLLVQSPYPEAEAWVTVEREGILSQQRMRLQGTATAIEIPITEEMIPNAFVGVVLARGRVDAPGKPGDPGRPSFRIGYRELRVVKAEKRLAVQVTPDAPEKRPGDELKVALAVTDRHGKGAPAELTVWAVDEGVLALTGYQTPDPIDALYRRRALSVHQTNNLLALVPQLSYGEKGRDAGGGGGAGEAMSMRSRFRTTPFFMGSVVAGPDGKATVTAKLPDNLTTFRIMAVAISNTDRGGSGASPVIVSKPLLARPALPRTARLGDRFTAGAVVHWRGDQPIEVKVTGKAEGPITALGGLERTLTLPPGKGIEVRFDFEATGIGEARMQFTVSGGGENDGVESHLPVKRPTALETVAIYG